MMGMEKLTKSEALQKALSQMGINTPYEALCHLPRRYENYAYTENKLHYNDKERVVFLGKVKGVPTMVKPRGKVLVRFYFSVVGGETFLVEAWNRSYLKSFLNEQDLFTLSASYDQKRHSLSLISILKGKIEEEHSLRPMYALPGEIPNHTFSSLIKRILDKGLGQEEEIIPNEFRMKYRLIPRYEAFKKAHFPKNYDDVHASSRTLKYEEALLFEMKNLAVKGANRALRKDLRRKVDREKINRFVDSLGYPLTKSQRHVIRECLADMDSEHIMYRLLQGDVGTGKTLVAALLGYANHLRSEQTALMAPTDSLARQHYENIKELFAGTRMDIALLVGATPLAEKKKIYEDLADGTIDFVIGTHSLFSSGVSFAYLGLAIIDEQHKFGVNQRNMLMDKGEHADLLLMSATPIPRTLTMTLYGDMDVSTLTEFPSGKRDVVTKAYAPGDSSIIERINASLRNDKRVYIVVPQIEGKEDERETSLKKIHAAFARLYPGKVVMMHGQMSEEEKNIAMYSFKQGISPILVATSLIEVGIDVKNADTMIIYSPSYFSLSSLHQLRGRIGRDGSKAMCIIVYRPEDEEEDANEKLKVFLSTDDGFKIAEADLRLRGPGDIVGTRQSGLPSFAYSNIINDFKVFECARDDATKILQNPDNPDYKSVIRRTEEVILKNKP